MGTCPCTLMTPSTARAGVLMTPRGEDVGDLLDMDPFMSELGCFL